MDDENIRLTTTRIKVLEIMLAATDDRPVWATDIAYRADLEVGTVSMILKKLRELGWAEGWTDEESSFQGAPRRYHELTPVGYQKAMQALLGRTERRRRKFVNYEQTGKGKRVTDATAYEGITAYEEMRLAEKRLRKAGYEANGWDWLPAIEKTHEDTLIVGVENENGDLLMGDGMAQNEVSEEDALYISLFSPSMAIPLADWIGDAADCLAVGGFVNPDAARLLGRALQFARKVNQRYAKIVARKN